MSLKHNQSEVQNVFQGPNFFRIGTQSGPNFEWHGDQMKTLGSRNGDMENKTYKTHLGPHGEWGPIGIYLGTKDSAVDFCLNFKWPEDPINLVKIKNHFGSLQTNPQADDWWVPPFFCWKKVFCETPLPAAHSRCYLQPCSRRQSSITQNSEFSVVSMKTPNL